MRMNSVKSQTWVIIACLLFMSLWCKRICCESVVHKTGNGLEQTIAEKIMSYGRPGLEQNRFHLAHNIPSHHENKLNIRSVNYGSVTCGKRPLMEHQNIKQVSPRPKLKIFGGMNAISGAYPWMVGLRFGSHMIGRVNKMHLCGGTILSEYWILSAAHCFMHVKKEDLVVRIGDLNNAAYDNHGQEFKIDVVITHKSFDTRNYDYDMALIKIRPQNGRGIVFNGNVQPACLPEDNTEYEAGKKCHITGWGITNKDWDPKILQAASVPIISDSECNRLYEGEITPRMFCAGFLPGGVDACTGDSGGPFVCDIEGRHTAMGVISWGNDCAKPNQPGVYAKVREVLPWIKEKTQLL